MRALIVAVVLSLPAHAQTEPPQRPAAEKAAAEKAAAEKAAQQKRQELDKKRLLEMLQAAEPARARNEVAVRQLLEKAIAEQARAQALQPNLTAQRIALLKQAVVLRRLATGEVTPTSPLMHGAYAEAVAALDAAREKMATAADPDAAFAALEAATKALMDARTALWRQQEAAKRDAPKPAPAKPDR